MRPFSLRGLAFVPFTLLCGLAGCAAEVGSPDELGEPVGPPGDEAAAAAWIVDGEIIELEPFEGEPVGVFTLARVRVARVVKGTLQSNELVLQVRGGRQGDFVTYVSHQPVLALGQRARFYLEPVFQADAEAMSSAEGAVAWAGGRETFGLHGGLGGMIELVPAGEPGVDRVQQALSKGCGPSDGYCFAIADIPYKFDSKAYRYRVNANTTDTGGVVPAVQMGFAAWEAEPSSRVDFVYDGTTSITTVGNDSVNAVFWSSTLLPASYMAATTVRVVHPTGRLSDPGYVDSFDMVFNDTKKWGVFSDNLIQHTAMHEAGHALGFDHVNDTAQVMYPSYQPTVRLGLGDRRGVQEWYRGPEVAAIGDFNGDLQDDVVTFVNGTSNGDAWVALSQGGSGFGTASVWRAGIYMPGSVVLVGRFNGDLRDDIAVLVPNATTWTAMVCTSTGTSFSNCGFWGLQLPDATTFKVGDVNGDGKDDLVAFTQGISGRVYVALSTGTGFGTPTTWYGAWFALGAEVPEVADIDGDGDDDLIAYGNGASGSAVWTAKSNRTTFDAAVAATNNLCYGGQKPLVGDFTGDGRADLGCLDESGNLFYMPARAQGGFGSYVSTQRTVPWRNSTVYVGRFPTPGSVVRFDHCTSADVNVYVRNALTGALAIPVKWHDYFAPGPCP